jgi:hypothetical protein
MRHGRARPGSPGLALLPAPTAPAQAPAPTISFCSHCGARPSADASGPHTRVCAACELGLLLQCRADVAPPVGAPFLVLDSSMSVCAVSAAAERLLATCETDAVNRHITELIVPADAEAQGRENLAVAVTWAARGDTTPHTVVVVRPANTFGVRLSARIATCGPHRAALLIFEPPSR